MIRKLAGSIWVRLLVTVVVLVPLLATVDLQATMAALRRLDFRLAAAVLGLLAVDRAIMIWRWVVLLRARGNRLSVASATSIFLVTSFVGTAVALAGDAARAYALTSRREAQGSEAFASVAVDRVLGLLAILAIALVGFGLAGARVSERSDVAFAATALALAALTWATLFADRWVRMAVPDAWHTTALGSQLLRLADAVAAYRGHRAALAAVLGLSVAVQLQRILQAYLLGIAIGIAVPFSYYLLFMPPGLVALMLPISVAGFGAPQGLIVWLLQPRGVPVADALALSTLIVLSGIVANVPGALIWLFTPRARV